MEPSKKEDDISQSKLQNLQKQISQKIEDESLRKRLEDKIKHESEKIKKYENSY